MAMTMMDNGPVTPQQLRPLFDAAATNTSGNLKSVEDALKSLEIKPGFHYSLLALVGDQTNSVGIRLQSVLYLKNGIDRYWRKTAPNAIMEEEKISIRSAILQMFVEPVYGVALQVAVIVGKIARFDVPKEWPELLPALTTGVQMEDTTVKHRALLVLYHTVKVLASKRLTSDRRMFHELTEQLLPFLLSIWKTHHSALIQSAASHGDESLTTVLQIVLITMKNLRRLIVHGLRKHHENNDCIAFLLSLFEEVKQILVLRQAKQQIAMELEKYSVMILKLFTDLLENHPYSFIPLLKDALQFICCLCFMEEGRTLVFQRLVIFCLNILKQIILCAEYKKSKHPDETNDKSPGKEAQIIKQEFFTSSTVSEICTQLLFQYLPLLQDDLVLWDSDPEQFCCDDGGDAWKYTYRPCCESLFLALFHENRDVLAPVLISYLKQCDVTNNMAPDLKTILQKDAIYNAVGLAAFDLFDEVDFDSWLSNGITNELAISDSNYRIIRRRVVWLIGQWSGVKLSPSYRPKLYELLLPVLRSEEDLVVRVQGAKALKIVIDDFEFCAEELQPYLQPAFDRLFCLLKEVEECDTKLSVLNVLAYLIERVGTGIRTMCEGLVMYLPQLWDASADHNMLRCAILTTLVVVVQGLGTACENISPFVYCVIKLSVDSKNEESVYLLEEGLELWLATLHNSKTLLPQWMELTRFMPPILELGSENLRTMLYIVQAYLYLAPEEFIINCGEKVCTRLNDQYADLQDEGVLLILRVVDLVLKVGPPGTPNKFGPLIFKSYQAVYQGTDYPMLMSLHLSIISWMLLRFTEDSTCFMNQLEDYNLSIGGGFTQDNNSITSAAGRILDVWIEKMPLVTQTDRRKLLALGLSSLILPTGSQVVQDRIYGIFQNVAETLNDIMKYEEDTQSYTDSLVISDKNPYEDGDETEYDTEHDSRKRAVATRDIVHCVSLRDYFQQKISEWGIGVGQIMYTDTITHIDCETASSLKEYISL